MAQVSEGSTSPGRQHFPSPHKDPGAAGWLAQHPSCSEHRPSLRAGWVQLAPARELRERPLHAWLCTGTNTPGANSPP